MDSEMTNALEKTRTELVVETADYNIGLTESDFTRRELESGARRPSEPRCSPSSSTAGASRSRRSSSLGALALAPRANITAHRQRHHRLVLEGRSGLPRLRALPRGVRRHAHADHRAQGRLGRPALLARRRSQLIDAITGDIERVDTVERVNSLATRQRSSTRSTGAGDDAGIEVRPLLDARSATHRRRPTSARRALDDDRSCAATSSRTDGTVDGDRRQLRRGPHRRRPRAASSSGSTTSSIRACRPARAPTTTAASRSARPTTASRSPTSASSRRRSCSSRSLRHLPDVPLVAQDAADAVRGRSSACSGRSGLYSLMGFTYNVLEQHARAARSSCWPSPTTCTSCSTATRSARAPATRSRRSRRRSRTCSRRCSAPARTTALGMLSLATSNVVAVRSFGIGVGGRRHGRLRDLARPGADAAGAACKPETARGAAGALASSRRCARSRGSRARRPGRVLAVAVGLR